MVILEVWNGHLVGLSAKDGRRRWILECGAVTGYLYGDRYYRLSARGYQMVDPRTGKVLLERRLSVPAALKRDGVMPTMPLLVSETHAFAGSDAGYVIAFERDTGEYAWSFRPRGGQGIATFHAEDGRLYYRDISLTVYCLAQEKGDAAGKKPSGKAGRGTPARASARSGSPRGGAKA